GRRAASTGARDSQRGAHAHRARVRGRALPGAGDHPRRVAQRRDIVGAMLMGLDRPAAAEFSFFLAIPTMAAAFGHDLLEVRHSLGAERVLEIAIGFVAAFIASVVVVRPFLGFIRRAGFAHFAWYGLALGLL